MRFALFTLMLVIAGFSNAEQKNFLKSERYHCTGERIPFGGITNVYSASDDDRYGLNFVSLWVTKEKVIVKGTKPAKEGRKTLFEQSYQRYSLDEGISGMKHVVFRTDKNLLKINWSFLLRLNGTKRGILEISNSSGSLRYYTYLIKC